MSDKLQFVVFGNRPPAILNKLLTGLRPITGLSFVSHDKLKFIGHIKSRPRLLMDGFGELLGLACGLTVCNFQKGGALGSETTEPQS